MNNLLLLETTYNSESTDTHTLVLETGEKRFTLSPEHFKNWVLYNHMKSYKFTHSITRNVTGVKSHTASWVVKKKPKQFAQFLNY